MQVGDLVVRTYGEGQRPTAILIDLVHYHHTVAAKVLWCNGDLGQISARYLEVVSRKKVIK